MFATFLVLGAVQAVAHPLHLSVTEATYDRETQRLQLAIRVFPDDLEAALSKDSGEKITLEDAATLAPAALAYLRKTLLVESATGKPARLEWAGLDVSKGHVWLFCEAPLPGGTLGSKFQIKIMTELFSDQLNSLQLTDGALKVTLVFDSHGTAKTIAVPRQP